MATQPPPRSPDVQVYRPQLTSVLSIAHRATGVWLSLGAIGLVIWLASVAAGGDIYVPVQTFLHSWIGGLFLLSWTFALYYHLCNGIRHLAWDLNYGFELVNIYRSGWLVVASSVCLTVVTWVIALVMMG